MKISSLISAFIIFAFLEASALAGEPRDNSNEMPGGGEIAAWNNVLALANESIVAWDDYRAAVKAYEKYLKAFPQGAHKKDAEANIAECKKEIKRIEEIEAVELPEVPYLDNVVLEEKPEVVVTIKTDNSSAVGFAYYVNGRAFECADLENRLLAQAKAVGFDGKYASWENPLPGVYCNLRVNIKMDNEVPVYAMQNIIHFCLWHHMPNITISAKLSEDTVANNKNKCGFIVPSIDAPLSKNPPYMDIGALRLEIRRIDSIGTAVRMRKYNEKFEDYFHTVRCVSTVFQPFCDQDYPKPIENASNIDFDKLHKVIISATSKYKPPRDAPELKMQVIIDSGELVIAGEAIRVLSHAKSLGISKVYLATPDLDWTGCPKNNRRDFMEKLCEKKL